MKGHQLFVRTTLAMAAACLAATSRGAEPAVYPVLVQVKAKGGAQDKLAGQVAERLSSAGFELLGPGGMEPLLTSLRNAGVDMDDPDALALSAECDVQVVVEVAAPDLGAGRPGDLIINAHAYDPSTSLRLAVVSRSCNAADLKGEARCAEPLAAELAQRLKRELGPAPAAGSHLMVVLNGLPKKGDFKVSALLKRSCGFAKLVTSTGALAVFHVHCARIAEELQSVLRADLAEQPDWPRAEFKMISDSIMLVTFPAAPVQIR